MINQFEFWQMAVFSPPLCTYQTSEHKRCRLIAERPQGPRLARCCFKLHNCANVNFTTKKKNTRKRSRQQISGYLFRLFFYVWILCIGTIWPETWHNNGFGRLAWFFSSGGNSSLERDENWIRYDRCVIINSEYSFWDGTDWIKLGQTLMAHSSSKQYPII